MRGLSSGMKVALVDAAAMALAVAVVAGLIAAFGSAGAQRVATHAGLLLVSVVSLQLFSGNTGIVSFGHAGFAGIGAYVVGVLTMPAAIQATALKNLPVLLAGYQLSLGSALVIVAVIAVVLGLATGAVLMRLTASSASIATLALLVIIVTVLVGAREITRGSQPFYGVPRGVGLATATAAAAIALILARLFRDTRTGRMTRASADDAVGAAAIGIDRRHGVLASWTLSVVGAMIAGGLTAQYIGAFKPQDFYFDLAFETLAMLIVGGLHSSFGALVGVGATTLLIEVARRLEEGGSFFGVEVPPVFGFTEAVLALAMLLVIWRRPEGLSGGHEMELLRRLVRLRPPAPAPEPDVRPPAAMLTTRAVGKRYAGVAAVADITLALPTGQVTGIIGPNGAGKTTLINLIAGQAAPSSGGVYVDAAPLAGLPAFRVARTGIARTFQNIRVFPHMSVLENVMTAAERIEPNAVAAERAARRELARLGLADHADRLAGTLPYGERRRLEIARALVTRPSFLLLDEPAAGMNPVETDALMAILAEVKRVRGLGIVLIEHDLGLVMRLCDRVAVLDHGRLITEGPPAVVRADPMVVEAYLGSRTSARALARLSEQTQ